MNPRGNGWKRADEITRLGEPRALILEAMKPKVTNAYDAKSTRQITFLCNEIRYARGLRGWEEHGVGGRLSEMVGLKLIEVIQGSVEEEDPRTKIYYTKPAAKYYLSDLGKAAPADPSWNPQSNSTVVIPDAIMRFWQ